MTGSPINQNEQKDLSISLGLFVFFAGLVPKFAFLVKYTRLPLGAADKIPDPEAVRTGRGVKIAIVFGVFHQAATTSEITVNARGILVIINGVPESLIIMAINNCFQWGFCDIAKRMFEHSFFIAKNASKNAKISKIFNRLDL